MTRWTLLYGLWCILIVAAFALSGSFGYSPFADGGRPVFFGGGGHAGGGFYGPVHK